MMPAICRTVGDLKNLLAKFPDDLPVKVLTTDGNGHCHEELQVSVQAQWTESLSDITRWRYKIRDEVYLEFK